MRRHCGGEHGSVQALERRNISHAVACHFHLIAIHDCGLFLYYTHSSLILARYEYLLACLIWTVWW